MARSYGALKVSVWEPGSEFRRLSPLAQWTYTMLLSQPQVSNLGVLPYTPEKWARFAAGLTIATLELAIDELAIEKFVVVDTATGELLVRTFIKHDKVWSQPKLVTNARRLIREVESVPIRTYLTSRHPWLLDTRLKEEIEAYEASPERGIETPSHTPSHTPIGEPVENHGQKGVTEPLPIPISPPRARPGPGPGPGSGVGTAARSKEELQVLGPVAAAETLEAPRPSAIREACERFRADTRKVEPLAQAMTAELFEATVDTVTTRISTGEVGNPAGLLMQLLKTNLREEKLAAAATIVRLSPADQIEQDARYYATRVPWDAAQPLIARKLERLNVDEDERERLLEHAQATYQLHNGPLPDHWAGGDELVETTDAMPAKETN